MEISTRKAEPSVCVRTWRASPLHRWTHAWTASLLGAAVLLALIIWMLSCPSCYDAVTGQPLCDADYGDDYSFGVFKVPAPSLQHINFEWLKQQYGHLNIWAAQSSVTQEDTTDADYGGLPERRRRFGGFLDDVASGRPILHNYLKVLDRPTLRQLDEVGLGPLLSLGRQIEETLRAALRRHAQIEPPEEAGWSLWIGSNGSTTSLHVDDQRFNVLLVLEGAKRFVLIPPNAREFECERPPRNPGACWAGVDVLSGALPSYAQQVIVRKGEAILLSEMYWHAVANLGPTIAVGMNEHPACTGRRFAALRPHRDEQARQATARHDATKSWFGDDTSGHRPTWTIPWDPGFGERRRRWVGDDDVDDDGGDEDD